MSSSVSKFSRTDNYQSQSSFKSYPNCDKPTFQSLPKDLLGQIFLHLNSRDLQSAVRLNRKMQIAVLDTAKTNVPDLMKIFIKSLKEKLGADSPLGKQLPEIPKSITDPNCKNLPLFKNYILGVKQGVAQVIKLLDVDAEGRLKAQIQLPEFMEDLFKLSAIERDIDKVKIAPNDQKRAHLDKIFKALVEVKDIDKAIEVARLHSGTDTELSLWHLSEVLRSAGNIDKAIEVALMIPREYQKSMALSEIVGVLAGAEHIERAVETAMMIPDITRKSMALVDLSGVLVNARDIVGSIQIATKIPCQWRLGHALKYILESFTKVKEGDILGAYHFVKRNILHEPTGSVALKEISVILIEEGKLEEALQVAEQMSDESVKSDARLSISRAFVKGKNISRAFDVAKTISHVSERSYASQSISEVLIKNKDFDRALECVRMILDEHIKSRLLLDLSRSLVKAGNYNMAFRAAEMISDKDKKNKHDKSIAFRFIAFDFQKRGLIENAIKIAEMIPDTTIKKAALKKIQSLK